LSFLPVAAGTGIGAAIIILEHLPLAINQAEIRSHYPLANPDISNRDGGRAGRIALAHTGFPVVGGRTQCHATSALGS
jgi:hypothetical protein